MTATEHLRRFLDTGEPDLALLTALAEMVRERIRKSGMWEHSPTFFGYPEYHSWREAFSGEDLSPGPAGDFFIEEIVSEQNFFRQTLRAGNSVDALLRQKIKWFLTDRQKKHDPVGYRAFMNLVAAIEAMVADGAVAATNLVRGKVRNPTVVRFTSVGPCALTEEGELSRLLDTDADWQPVLRRIAKLGSGAQQVLRQRLDRFPSVGVGAFTVGELAAVLKAKSREVNEAWNRPQERDSPDSSTEQNNSGQIRTDLSDGSYSFPEGDLAALHHKVRVAIDGADFTPKVKRGMGVVLEDWLKYLGAGLTHPPLREWASQLGLPKSSLGDYRQRLLPLLRAALEARNRTDP